MNEHLKKAYKLAGGITRIAKACGVSPGAVSQWSRNGVPAERCPTIERLTGGQVRCEDLCPDVEWFVLRQGKKKRSGCTKPEREKDRA